MEITEDEIQLVQEINDTVNRLNLLLSKVIRSGLKVIYDVNVLDVTRMGDRGPIELIDFDVRVFKEIW
jgi:archaellum component FlaC